MKGYVFCIAVTLLLSAFAELALKKGRKKSGILFLILSGLVMSIVAGVRSDSVGRDINNYVSPLFYKFLSGYSVKEVYSMFNSEIGYTMLVYIFSIFKNLNVVLLGIELAVVLPILIYSYKVRDKVSITLNIFIFLMTMYSYSFSMMRQSIAISIGVLALYYFANNFNKRGFACVLLAYLFHRTAIVLIFIYLFAKNIFHFKKYNYLLPTIFLSIISLFLIIGFVSFLPLRYSNYLNNGDITAFNIPSFVKIAIWLVPIFFLLYLVRDKSSTKYNDLKLSIVLIIFGMAVYLIGIVIPVFGRLSLYFSNIASFVYIPYLVKSTKPKVISLIVFSSVLIFLWWHMTTNSPSAQIYPYRSELVSFLND